jgi:hypothetical protein
MLLTNPAALQVKTRITSLTASLLWCDERIELLRRMCRSISAQIGVGPHVRHVVGVSGPLATPEAVVQLRVEFPRVSFAELGIEPLAQFEAYYRLVKDELHSHPDMEWFMFSDDDDVWHPERAAVYALHAAGAHDTKVRQPCLG